MDLLLFGKLAGIGLVGGVLAGFVGIGGGVVIVPLLIYIAGLPVKLATGVSMVQAFFATISGVVVHRRNHTVDLRLGIALGASAVIGGFIGSFGSAYIPDRVLLTVYFCLVVFAVFLMFLAPKDGQPERVNPSLPPTLLMGLGIGIVAGMLGVGGGFIGTPLMIALLHIPTRIAVGTSLLMILPTTVSGSIGKIATGQFDLQMATAIIVGSIIGAQIGGRMNARVAPKAIRATLIVLLVIIMARTGADLIGI